MRMQDELWQGYSGYWQNRFIHHNILPLGYIAWLGYLNHGRGLVVCEVVDAILPTIDWSLDPVTFNQTFISQVQAAQYLQVLELNQAATAALLNAIATYDPAKAMVVLVTGNGGVDINLLQDLAISPADCYQQVQRRWAEFQPGLMAQSGHG